MFLIFEDLLAAVEVVQQLFDETNLVVSGFTI